MHCYASIDKKCFVSRAFCLLTTVFMSLLFALLLWILKKSKHQAEDIG